LLTTEGQSEVTSNRIGEIERRLQQVEDVVSQLCMLHEQTLQLIAALYDVTASQRAKDIQTATEVRRIAHQYVEQIRLRKHKQGPEV
jgi:CII-binding regulator of phage lambda lysogenization HflD